MVYEKGPGKVYGIRFLNALRARNQKFLRTGEISWKNVTLINISSAAHEMKAW